MGLLARSWVVLGFHVLLSGGLMGLLVRSWVVFGVHVLYCISLLHIFVSYFHCLSLSHISVAYLYCLSLLHIFIAYFCCISVLHIYIAYLCCCVVVFCRLGFGVDVWSFGGVLRRFLIVLESILGPFGGSFPVMLAPFSAQVGLGTVFEPTYHRKSDLSRNITVSNGFCSKLSPR